ncbi:lipocalin family protein [Mesonia sp. MT50]|uniref:Lipocalin family protein n=1 Tax=Mesonia profundi TaxID=3070998 RepID=A0ABU0ZYW8_9FLAO|nr:lipocalin family protein [Mesonia profundi]MDQ7916654.1 lipocalin family protein [Mesonia profundi]
MKLVCSKSILVTFLLSIMVLSSCSSNDDSPIQEIIDPEEAIVGKWSLLAREPDAIKGCEFGTTITFIENNKLYYRLSYGDDFSNCEVDEINGNWEYLGENQFKLTFNDQTRVVVIEIYDDYERFKLYSLDDLDAIEFYVRGS